MAAVWSAGPSPATLWAIQHHARPLEAYQSYHHADVAATADGARLVEIDLDPLDRELLEDQRATSSASVSTSWYSLVSTKASTRLATDL